jgi:hypothetical protein
MRKWLSQYAHAFLTPNAPYYFQAKGPMVSFEGPLENLSFHSLGPHYHLLLEPKFMLSRFVRVLEKI